MPRSPDHQNNHLLARLSFEERNRLFPYLQYVAMPLGKALYESGDRLRDVYFPVDCIVSLLYVMGNGASAEIAIVSNEGLIGIGLFMGGENYAQPRHRAECWICISVGRAETQRRVSTQRGISGFPAALHPGSNYPDGAHRGVQSASLRRPATGSLATFIPRSIAIKSTGHD